MIARLIARMMRSNNDSSRGASKRRSPPNNIINKEIVSKCARNNDTKSQLVIRCMTRRAAGAAHYSETAVGVTT